MWRLQLACPSSVHTTPKTLSLASLPLNLKKRNLKVLGAGSWLNRQEFQGLRSLEHVLEKGHDSLTLYTLHPMGKVQLRKGQSGAPYSTGPSCLVLREALQRADKIPGSSHVCICSSLGHQLPIWCLAPALCSISICGMNEPLEFI